MLIPAMAPSGGFGMLVDDAAFAAAGRLPEPGSLYRNEIAARSVLLYDEWNPTPHARALRVPILLIASRSDRFVPFTAVEALARDGADVRVEEIGGDHFDIYASPQRERAAALASEFLARQLQMGGAAGAD